MNNYFEAHEQAEGFPIGKRISLSRPSAKFLLLGEALKGKRCFLSDC